MHTGFGKVARNVRNRLPHHVPGHLVAVEIDDGLVHLDLGRRAARWCACGSRAGHATLFKQPIGLRLGEVRERQRQCAGLGPGIPDDKEAAMGSNLVQA